MSTTGSEPGGSGPLRRSWRWLEENGRDTFGSVDFFVGLGAGLAAGLATARYDSVKSRLDVALVAEMALAAAILAAALTALAILVGVLSEEYLRVLEHAGGVKAAITPYHTVAVVAGLGVLAAGAAALLIPALGESWEPALFGAATGLTAWATWGAVQLVGMTAFHGQMKGELLQGITEAKAQVRQIQEQRRASQ